MPQRKQASVGGEIEAFGIRRVRDGRDETPTAAIIEDAPVQSGKTLSVRYSPHDWRTIWGAAALGYTRILSALLQRGENVDRRDMDGRTALIHATDFNQSASLCLLLEYGAAPNATDATGRTAAFFVNGPHSETLLTILVNGGADLNIVDHRGHSPLFQAKVNGFHRLGSQLERRGAQTGFMEAVAAGDLDLASRLPVYGDLNARLPNGETLLIRATRRGNFRLVALLLERGADPNCTDASGRTPLDAAASDSRGRLLRLLLDAGADPYLAHSLDRSTLLQWAGIELQTEDTSAEESVTPPRDPLPR